MESVLHEMPILSPEKTIVTYRLAGLGSRILAHVLDAFLALVFTAIFVVLAGLLAFVDPGIAQLVQIVSGTFGFFAYFIILETFWNGQTLGKRAMNLRVRSVDGTPVTFLGVLGRNLLRVADFLPGFYFAGLVSMFTNSKSQRFGDMIAGTVVCHEPMAMPTFTPAPHQAGVHRLESAVGELRHVSTEEYIALRRFCDRFPELPVEVQHRLIAEVWTPFARRHGIEAPFNTSPLELAEAVVMRYGRTRGLL